MGLFGGGGDDGQSRETQDLLNQQIRQNQAELESKRQNLFTQRMDIIKSQGSQIWYPKPTSAGASAGKGMPSGAMPWFGGKML